MHIATYLFIFIIGISVGATLMAFCMASERDRDNNID